MSSSDRFYTRFDAVFFEKTRLSMITLLHQEGRVSFNRFRKLLGGTDGSIYSHLQKLLSAGYIDQKRQMAGDKPQTVYALTPAGRKLFKDYLVFLESFLKQEGEGTGAT
jgi:DNA-binding PadR family transcriptional regulator